LLWEGGVIERKERRHYTREFKLETVRLAPAVVGYPHSGSAHGEPPDIWGAAGSTPNLAHEALPAAATRWPS